MFIPGDLILRRVVGSMKNPSWGKLGPNWEGPYQVILVARVAACHWEVLDGIMVPQPWNVNNLLKYYY